MKHFFTSVFLLACLCLSNTLQAQCESPSIVWDEDGLIINWIAKDGATSHIVRYRETGTFNWTEVEVMEDSFLEISFLESCVNYDFRVRTICGNDQSSFTPVYVAAANCGTCYAEYCDFPDVNDGITFITYVRANDYVQESQATGGGYEDFRGVPNIVFPPGADVEMEFRMSEDGFYNNTLSVYLDLNRDLEFTSDEQIVNEAIQPFIPVISQVSIPGNINFGITRMRVVIGGFNYDEIEACEGPNIPFWGEVEEYCVILGEVPSACDFDFTVELDGVSSGSADFTWDDLSAAQAYNFRYKKTEEPDEEWNELATVQPEALLSMLDDCSEYEFEVRGVCPFDTSAYKNRIVFNSFCPTGINQDPLVITNITTYPNPWSNKLNLQFTSKENEAISIAAINLDGRRFQLQNNLNIYTGENKLSIDNTEQLATGVYFIEITNSDNRKWYHKALKIQ